nr:MAG TPA: hypothetical protein [Caudoviricetes sp.]DAQ87212.1 MAG TPA: hypothetical protein [Caudoviricetes sp.]
MSSYNSKDILKLFLNKGWTVKSQKGSHLKVFKIGYGTVIIPMHNKDLKKGIIKDLIKKYGLE